MQKLIYRLKLHLHCRKSMRGTLSSIADLLETNAKKPARERLTVDFRENLTRFFH